MQEWLEYEPHMPKDDKNAVTAWELQKYIYA
jgi:hypothetical protein